MKNVTDHAIQKLNEKIAVLRLAIAEIENARDVQEVVDAPKVRKTRKPRGLPPGADKGGL